MKVKTPCIGICSTTSLGDTVCRGCKRYAFEVIQWNSYDAQAKQAVLKRSEKLIVQILENKFRIFSVPNLKLALDQTSIPYDESLSPYTWLHNLLKKNHQQIGDLKHFGTYALPDYAQYSVAELAEMVEEELILLCEAHLDRYYADAPKTGTRQGKQTG